MNVLLDACVPRRVRNFLSQHTVRTAQEMGWAHLQNGALLKQAEKEFHSFITTDKNLRYQQNLADRKLAILVLPTNDWQQLKQHPAQIAEATNKLATGDFVELTF